MSEGLEKLISVRRFHSILTDCLISLQYQVSVDGQPPMKNCYVELIRRRTFSNIISSSRGPQLLNFRIESWQFIDGGLQALQSVYGPLQLDQKIPSSLPGYAPEERQQAS